MQDPVRIAAALLVILQTALVAAIAVRLLNAKRGGTGLWRSNYPE
jgi:hypothetical protein